MLVSRRFSQWVCALGLTQLFFATGLVVCGFVVLGLFGQINGIGLWLGLPALIPGLVSVVVLGTRHTKASLVVAFTSLVIFAIGIWHAVEIYNEIDFWEKYRDYAEAMVTHPLCYHNGYHCICHDFNDYVDSGYTVKFCDQFRVGEELFWTMFVFSLGIIFFSIFNFVIALVASFMGLAKDYDETDRGMKPPEYELPRGHKSYPVTR